MTDSVQNLTTWLTMGAAGMALLMVILAPTTWPSEGVDFWDHQAESSSGFSVEVTTYGDVGWYLAMAATLMLGAIAATSMIRTDEPSAAAVPSALAASATDSPSKCQATTKSGAHCSRNATRGKFCGTHT